MENSRRSALVTGASRGIGAGIALALARQGYGVAVNYRNSLELAIEVKSRCLAAGAAWCEVVQADIARIEEHDRLLDAVYDIAGRLDVLVNNAGISSPKRADVLELPLSNWDLVLATNLKGPFFLTQNAAKRMIRLKTGRSASGGDAEPGAGSPSPPLGVVVFVTSISAIAASVERAEYCTAKAGLSMVAKLFAHRLAPENILVYEVRPGLIRTDMTKAAAERYDELIAQGLLPLPRWGEPDDVGRTVAMLAEGHLSYSTGEILHVDGGWQARKL